MIQKTFRCFTHFALIIGALTLMSAAAFAQYPIGQSSIGDMKPGSVLFFSRYTSNPMNPAIGDTQINITNLNPNSGVNIHLFFVDGATCSIADGGISLTQNQTASFLASDYDPGISGYLIAVANGSSGPAQFNYLIGTEFIRETDGRAGYLQAITVGKRSAGDVVPNENGQTVLNFNGVDYEQLPSMLAVAAFNSQTSDSSNLAIFSPPSDMFIGGVTTTNIQVLLFNDAETPLSSSFNVNCYRYDSFTALFNRGGGINRHVPSGRTGWIRLDGSGRPILGSVIGKGPVFVGSHNLHAMRLLSSYSIVVPFF